eukprot:PhM_4_TR17558/c8_g2_i1/m.42635
MTLTHITEQNTITTVCPGRKAQTKDGEGGPPFVGHEAPPGKSRCRWCGRVVGNNDVNSSAAAAAIPVHRMRITDRKVDHDKTMLQMLEHTLRRVLDVDGRETMPTRAELTHVLQSAITYVNHVDVSLRRATDVRTQLEADLEATRATLQNATDTNRKLNADVHELKEALADKKWECFGRRDIVPVPPEPKTPLLGAQSLLAMNVVSEAKVREEMLRIDNGTGRYTRWECFTVCKGVEIAGVDLGAVEHVCCQFGLDNSLTPEEVHMVALALLNRH